MMSHYKMIAKKMEHKSEDPIEVESGKQVYDSTPDGIPHDIVEEKPASKSVSKHPREENEEEEPEEEKKPANRKKVAREGDEDEFVFEVSLPSFRLAVGCELSYILLDRQQSARKRSQVQGQNVDRHS